MLAGVMDAWRGTLGSMACPSTRGEGLNENGSGALSDKRPVRSKSLHLPFRL